MCGVTLRLFNLMSILFITGCLALAQPLSAILPKNGAFLSDFNVSYSWNNAPAATNYRVMVATNATFTSNYFESPIIGQTSWSSFVPLQGKYYWRIKAYIPNDSILSPTYTFNYFTPSGSLSTTFWLKADAGISLDAGNKVQSWTDLSANGYSVIQNIVAKRPVITNNSLNGYPSVQFSGAQVLSGGDILDIGFNSRSIFIMGKMAASNQSLLAKSKAANATFRYGVIKDAANTAFLFQSDNNTSNYSAFNTTNYALYNAFVNRSTAKNHFDVNNASLGINNFNSSLLFESNYRLLLGAYNNANDDGEVLFLNGNICEIIFSDTNDSTTILKIKNYLKYKYTAAFNLGTDITVTNGFCPQTITAPAGFTGYLWNTGATTASISANQTGAYWVSATDAFGFKWTDTLYVKFPTIATPPSNIVCANTSVNWNTGLGAGFTHLWSTGSTQNNITISQAGTYSVQITGAGGCNSVFAPITFTMDNYPLTAFIGADTTLCTGNTLGLQVGANTTVQYLWSDGSTNPTYTVSAQGTYNVSLNSTNNNGCQAQDTIAITVAGFAPQVTLNLPASTCTNIPILMWIQFTSPQPIIPQSVDWTFSNGLNLSGNYVQFNESNPSNIQGSVTIVAQDNCTTSIPFAISVSLPPVLGITHVGSCSNAPVTFSAMDSLGSPLIDYSWDFFGGQGFGNDTVATPSFVYQLSGAAYAQLIAQNQGGCTDTLFYGFSLSAAPSAAFTHSNYCEQSDLLLSNNSTSNDTTSLVAYHWDFGDTNFSSLATPYQAYQQEGNYSISLIATAGNGCEDTVIQTLSIQPVPDLAWTISPTCKDIVTGFESQSTIPSGTVDSTSWLVNLQFPLNGTHGSYLFTTLGIQYLELQCVSDLGCVKDTLILVNVNPGVYSSLNYQPAILLAGDTLSLFSQCSGQTAQSWYINQQPYGSANALTLLVDDSLEGQTLDVMLIAQNAFGCSDTSFAALEVNERILDLEVKEVFHDEINGVHQVAAQLHNLGTVPITKARLRLSLSGRELFTSYFNDTIFAGGSYYYLFPMTPNFSALSQNNIGDFYCVQAALDPFYPLSEMDLSNNEKCAVLEDQAFEISAPCPNPATNTTHITLIVNQKSTITLEVVNTMGQQIIQLFQNEDFEPGTYSFSLDMKQWSAGYYFIKCLHENRSNIYRAIKTSE